MNMMITTLAHETVYDNQVLYHAAKNVTLYCMGKGPFKDNLLGVKSVMPFVLKDKTRTK